MDFHRKLVSAGDIFYFSCLRNSLDGCASVLDLGCGDNSPLRNIKSVTYSVGFDAFRESVEKSKKKRIHTEYRLGDLKKIDKYFNNKSFDAVVALDVIEHLDKKESIDLIKKMEKIARKKVVILTPNGFYHQDAYGSNPYQVHKSAWTAKELQKLGYSVRGLRGLKYLRGEYATIKHKPWIVWGTVAFLSEIILYFFPTFSYHIFAIKKNNS